ncbi:MAG: hypothetical protein AAGE99_05060, partial [Chlamydiota bacterium]
KMVFITSAMLRQAKGPFKWRKVGEDKMRLARPSASKAKENPLGDEHFMEQYEVYPDGVDRKVKVAKRKRPPATGGSKKSKKSKVKLSPVAKPKKKKKKPPAKRKNKKKTLLDD